MTEPAAFGVLLVDKPPGPTSHDVVSFVRWALHGRTVGHCGTLDPAATGLLILCIGEATKLVEHLTNVDKSYRARFVFGRSTTTADADGETLLEAPPADGVEHEAARALEAMIGEFSLPPPAYSAVKLGGRRAHEMARAGDVVELPERPMAIRSVTDVEVSRSGGSSSRSGSRPELAFVDATLEVAKGTYIRSIAEELGRRVGAPAHLGALHRRSCGGLSLEGDRVVSGLIADRLEPPVEKASLLDVFPTSLLEAMPPRPPRWRIHTDETRGREALGEFLRDRLIAPWTCLPFEARVLEPNDEVLATWARLRHGQQVVLESVPADFHGLDGLCAFVIPAEGEMVVTNRSEALLAPTRWIRFDPNRPAEGGASG